MGRKDGDELRAWKGRYLGLVHSRKQKCYIMLLRWMLISFQLSHSRCEASMLSLIHGIFQQRRLGELHLPGTYGIDNEASLRHERVWIGSLSSPERRNGS